jgi:hypothetical protein
MTPSGIEKYCRYKVIFTIEQPIRAQRGSGGIPLLFL